MAGPVGDGTGLTDRYEQLRGAVLAGTGDGLRLGLGVLTCRGMAAWMTAWQVTPPAPAGRVPSARPAQATGTSAGDMVQVLASMALAHL